MDEPNPSNEEKIKQGLKDRYERKKKTEMTKTKNTETILKKKQNNVIKDIL